MLIDPEKILQVIRTKFADRPFTMGDVYYALEEKWNKSKFGSLFNTIKRFTKEGILSYTIKVVGTPLMDSKTKRKGAAFHLK